MGFRNLFAEGVCVLAVLSIAQAMFLYPRTVGWNEDPCGPTLAMLRPFRIPGVPLSPENPPNNTAGTAPTNRFGLNSLAFMMEGYDAADIPDLPVNPYGGPGFPAVPGAVPGAAPGMPGVGAGAPAANPGLGVPGVPGLPYQFSECRCEMGCAMNGGFTYQKYQHQCAIEMGLSCCCNRG